MRPSSSWRPRSTLCSRREPTDEEKADRRASPARARVVVLLPLGARRPRAPWRLPYRERPPKPTGLSGRARARAYLSPDTGHTPLAPCDICICLASPSSMPFVCKGASGLAAPSKATCLHHVSCHLSKTRGGGSRGWASAGLPTTYFALAPRESVCGRFSRFFFKKLMFLREKNINLSS